MSKHTPTPWVIKKAARASACGIKTVEDIFGANGYRVLVNPMPADRTLIVDSVNALADRDPSKLADLEKAAADAESILRLVRFRGLGNSTGQMKPEELEEYENAIRTALAAFRTPVAKVEPTQEHAQ